MLRKVVIAYDFACLNGGQARVAMESARLLADAGIEVTYLAAVGPADPMLTHPLVKVICLNQSDILADSNRARAALSGIWNAEAAQALEAACADEDPKSTVLHCHGYAKALSPSVGPTLCHGPLKSVMTVHEYFLACPNGAFFDYPANAICKRHPLKLDCLTTNCDARHAGHKVWRVARNVTGAMFGQLPGKLPHAIHISRTAERVMAPYMIGDTTLHYVPNMVSAPTAMAPRAEPNLFVFCGRLSREKGAVHFAVAARELGVRAVFLGSGPEEEAVRRANPEAEVLGWQPTEIVHEWISKAQAFVFPSMWYETFGLSALEALFQGVPVVCGAWNAAAEHVHEGTSGTLYDEPTIPALKDAIRRAAALERHDSSELHDRFSPQTHLANLLRTYEQILTTPTPRQ